MAGEKIICNKSDLTAVADAIRTKLGVTDSYHVSELSNAINSISTGIQLPTLINPGTASDLLVGKELIDQDGNVVTGTIPTKTAATITPGTADQTISSGIYLTGVQTIKGDSNLVASNIKSGTSIFGVTGAYVDSTPIEISTDAEMEAVLTSDNVGKVYKFTGTTGTYTNGDLYIVEVG